MAFGDDSTLQHHYMGPFGCIVQMNMPEPGLTNPCLEQESDISCR